MAKKSLAKKIRAPKITSELLGKFGCSFRLVFETRKSAAFVEAFCACVVVQSKWFAIYSLCQCDFWQSCNIVGSAKCGSLVAKSSFWVWHVLVLLLKSVYFFSL
jgi:hypothetical protein